jgi:hypothetical protein
MKVVGFSFIRNAVKYQYPIVEAVRSILPLCEEVIVAVGRSEDKTRELVASIDPRVKIIDTEWDETLRQGGRVLAVETDKAFRALPEDADWCVYIQGDEVLHEDGYNNISEAMQRWKDDKRVDGLLLNYRHFFGSYDFIGSEGHWYRHEVRIIRRNPSIYSYRDAQGFRKGNNEKLNVKPVDAWIHHYGWVQDARTMKEKFIFKDKINFNKDNNEEIIEVPKNFQLTVISALDLFKGTHPSVMSDRIRNIGWKFEYDTRNNSLSFKDHFKNFIEKLTGKRPFDYQNYKIN